MLPEAVNYWSKALRVRRTENTIRLSRKCQHNQVFFKVNCQKKRQCPTPSANKILYFLQNVLKFGTVFAHFINTFFSILKADDPNPYCKNDCEHTMCGEVEVPELHLDVCRVCNAFGQNCMTKGSTEPGDGIKDADFVFYISAMQTERCQKGMTVAYAAHCQQESALDRFVLYVQVPN